MRYLKLYQLMLIFDVRLSAIAVIVFRSSFELYFLCVFFKLVCEEVKNEFYKRFSLHVEGKTVDVKFKNVKVSRNGIEVDGILYDVERICHVESTFCFKGRRKRIEAGILRYIVSFLLYDVRGNCFDVRENRKKYKMNNGIRLFSG